ncbi:MAG: phospholipase [Leptospira sp.]|jgi:hypothetical protein|nr:phospholipase [Leptospira sp.]NCS92296.1 phospholipase [Leptospira sp.]
MKQKVALSLIVFLTFQTILYAWGEHSLGTYPSLRADQNLLNEKKVKIESLEAFLIAEEDSLAAFLEDKDKTYSTQFASYPLLPNELKFKKGFGKAELKTKFLMALRINPNFKTLSYVQTLPNEKYPNCKKLLPQKITVFKDNSFWDGVNFCSLSNGQMVHPIDVIATASDEPDYGIDIGLFEDNGSEYGKIYGFGQQSYGNPALEFSSQTPFHIGYYYENFVMFGLAGYLKKNYPHFRAQQFLDLSKFAFSKGHDYWGYRFLGWGLHYVQDLTQPYHSTVSPNASTLGLMWVNLKSGLGFETSMNQTITLLSNRHLVIEDIQRHSLVDINLNKETSHPFILAFKNVRNDTTYPKFDSSYVVSVVAKESNSKAKILDQAIVDSIPEKFVDDPNYSYDSHNGNENIYTYLLREDPKSFDQLSPSLIDLFQSFGSHTRNFVKAGMVKN